MFSRFRCPNVRGGRRTATRLPVPVMPVSRAVDADGDEFVLDFGIDASATAGAPAWNDVETDSVAARLANERISNRFRAEHRGLT